MPSFCPGSAGCGCPGTVNTWPGSLGTGCPGTLSARPGSAGCGCPGTANTWPGSLGCGCPGTLSVRAGSAGGAFDAEGRRNVACVKHDECLAGVDQLEDLHRVRESDDEHAHAQIGALFRREVRGLADGGIRRLVGPCDRGDANVVAHVGRDV